jgi:protein SMG8
MFHAQDTAQRLINLDMPLYTPCHCHTPKGLLAQLMRVYTVTPEGPIRVLLHPQVRPAPPPCVTFHPGAGEIELPPAGVWVLRLPYPFAVLFLVNIVLIIIIIILNAI